MSIPKTPLEPDDFPVSADGKKIKKQDGTPIANTDDRLWLPTLSSALTKTKPGVKRISGQPDYANRPVTSRRRLGAVARAGRRCSRGAARAGNISPSFDKSPEQHDTHSKNMMMYWLMARSAPAAHPSTNTTSRIIIGGLRSGGSPEQPQN
jgi:hypothetical protein